MWKEKTLSLNRTEKATVVSDVAAQVARSQTLALAEYRGMTVAHLERCARSHARRASIFTC
jgi:large subunit ribosomal protein L10